jgi:hypothetical protein
MHGHYEQMSLLQHKIWSNKNEKATSSCCMRCNRGLVVVISKVDTHIKKVNMVH